MDKYKQSAEKWLKGVHPEVKAKEALVKAEFASRDREVFFDGAYGELMMAYFLQFIGTAPHEVKSREFIYSCVVSLGHVKQKLAEYETYGKNIQHLGREVEDDGQ